MILDDKAKRASKELNGVLRARGMIFFADNESHKRHVGTKWLIEAKEKVQLEKLTALKEKKNEEIIYDEKANLSFFKEDGNYVYFKKSQNPISSEGKDATILASIAPEGATHDEILKHETERMDYLSIVSYHFKK
jgi:hypothetical protein